MDTYKDHLVFLVRFIWGLTKPHSLTVYTQAMLTCCIIFCIYSLVQLAFLGWYYTAVFSRQTTAILIRPTAESYKKITTAGLVDCKCSGGGVAKERLWTLIWESSLSSQPGVCNSALVRCGLMLWGEELKYIRWGKTRERGTMCAAMGKPSYVRGENSPVWLLLSPFSCQWPFTMLCKEVQ